MIAAKPRRRRRKIGTVTRMPWTPEACALFEREGIFKFVKGDPTPASYTVRTNKLTLTYQLKHKVGGIEWLTTIRVDKRFPPL